MAKLTDLIVVLQRHPGRENGVTAQQLAHLLDCHPRQVRELVTEAREAGHAICGHPTAGGGFATTPRRASPGLFGVPGKLVKL